MSIHVHANFLTHYGVASNNRGETSGVVATLQKICWGGSMHTTVSSEAIRAAIRSCIPEGERNRVETPDGGFAFKDKTFSSPYVDDIAMGWMDAQAPKFDGSDVADNKETNGKGKNGRTPKQKGTCNARRGIFEANRMVSLTPWQYDVSFNVGRKGSNLGSKKADHGNIFGSEMHATRYQWPFTLTPENVPEQFREQILRFLGYTTQASHVAGNHSRYAFDYSPESIIVRVTHSFSSRIMYCFDEDGGASKLIKQVEMGDIDAKELIIGGFFADTDDGKKLASLGAFVPNPHGVSKAMEEVVRRTRSLCGWE